MGRRLCFVQALETDAIVRLVTKIHSKTILVALWNLPITPNNPCSFGLDDERQDRNASQG